MRNWHGVQNREREFFAPAITLGDYVFSFENGRLPRPDAIRQRIDRLAAGFVGRVSALSSTVVEEQLEVTVRCAR